MESNTYKLRLQKLKGTWTTYVFIIGIALTFLNRYIGLGIIVIALALFFKYKKDPDNLSSLYYNLALNTYSKGDSKQAKTALNNSIAYNKQNKEAYFFLGCLCFDEKDYTNALNYLKLGGVDEVKDPSLTYVLGRCYFHVEDYNKSIEYLEMISYDGIEALEKERLFTLGKAYCEEENYDKGYEYLNTANLPMDELKGDALEYCYYLGVASYNTDRDEEAKGLLSKVYEKDKYYKYIDVYAKEIPLV